MYFVEFCTQQIVWRCYEPKIIPGWLLEVVERRYTKKLSRSKISPGTMVSISIFWWFFMMFPWKNDAFFRILTSNAKRWQKIDLKNRLPGLVKSPYCQGSLLWVFRFFNENLVNTFWWISMVFLTESSRILAKFSIFSQL